METRSRILDIAASACLAAGNTPDQFATDVARALYPAFDMFLARSYLAPQP